MIVLLALTGCAVGPDFVRPDPPGVDRYVPEEQTLTIVPVNGQVQHFAPDAEVVANWWRLFKSPKLDALVQEAIDHNQSLQAAQASLRRSQENLRAGYGIFYPQIDLAAGLSRQRFSAARFGSPASSIFNLLTMSATVSYALDIFGGQRRAVEGLGAQRDFQRYTVLATYLTLTGNIVNTVVARAAYAAQIAATRQLIGIQQEQIALAETQVKSGIAAYASVVDLKAKLAALQATLAPLEQKHSQAEHLLSALTGHAPGERALPPADLPMSLPSQLVRQRPDILAAEATVHENSANIGVATAELLPSFTVSGTYGQNTRNLADVFMSSGNFWSVGGNIVAPLFRGGTSWLHRKAAIAAYQQSLASYKQTALDALAQVADILLALEHDAEALRSYAQQLDLTQESVRLAQTNYQAGLADYLHVLSIKSQFFQAKLVYLQAQAQRLQDTAALFVALGGGWWNDDKRQGSLLKPEALVSFRP